jgi:DNA-binding transcriptional ArsR family regulator
MPTRLTLAAALRDGDELCVCDLSWVAERAENLVSHHVRALRTAGLVRSRRDGKMVMYALTERGRALVDAHSLIEAMAGLVVIWRLANAHAMSERRAQQLIAVSFYVLSAYVAIEASRSLVVADRPAVSWVGIGLSIVTLATMPPLAMAKARVADALGSSATKSESRQTMLCAYLSAGLLVGLGLNALLGWWWADPVTALGIAGVAVKEGRDAWRGESCCTAPITNREEDGCGKGCC